MLGKKLIAALVVVFTLAAASAQAQSALTWGTMISGPNDTRLTPTPFGVPGVASVEASNSASYVITTEGRVFAQGNNNSGQLGDGTFTDRPSEAVEVHLPPAVHVVAIGEADNEAMAVDSEGNGWVWGSNQSSSLCLAHEPRITTPIKLTSMSGLVAVQGGGKHSLWLDNEGHVRVCGSNRKGMLGLGEDVTGTGTPTEVPGLPPIVEVSAGGGYSMVRDNEGQVLMWGSNEQGQIGIGSSAEAIYTPQPVPLPEAAAQISAGGDLSNGGSCAKLTGGSIYCWGADEKGALGDGQSGKGANKASPVLATAIEAVGPIAEVRTSGAMTVVLNSEGQVWEVGSNQGGDFGIPGLKPRAYTTAQFLEAGVSQIAATARNTMDVHP